MREGFNPDDTKSGDGDLMHNLDTPFAVGDESEGSDAEPSRDELGQEQPWEHKDYSNTSLAQPSPEYGSLNEERHVWSESGK